MQYSGGIGSIGTAPRRRGAVDEWRAAGKLQYLRHDGARRRPYAVRARIACKKRVLDDGGVGGGGAQKGKSAAVTRARGVAVCAPPRPLLAGACAGDGGKVARNFPTASRGSDGTCPRT